MARPKRGCEPSKIPVRLANLRNRRNYYRRVGKPEMIKGIDEEIERLVNLRRARKLAHKTNVLAKDVKIKRDTGFQDVKTPVPATENTEARGMDFDWMMKNPEIAARALKTSFLHYVAVFHKYLFNKDFVFKPFYLDVIKALEDIVFGRAEKKNLCINMAPRLGKSKLMRRFVEWSYAINPACNFIATSSGDDLAMEMSKEIMDTMSTPLYQALFGVKFAAGSESKGLWKTENQGTFRAAPLQGAIVGFGAGIAEDDFGGALIVDDPLKPQDARSATRKQECIDTFDDTIQSRLNGPHTPIILNMQRLDIDDLTGHIERKYAEDYKFLKIPALRDDNTSIYEARLPAKKLLGIKEKNPPVFWAQYQQEPIVRGGDVFKREWWRYWDTSQQVEFKKLFLVGDTAFKSKKIHDYQAFGLFGITRDNFLYLVDILHIKCDAADLKKKLVLFVSKWQNGIGGRKITKLIVEDKASGIQLIQEWRKSFAYYIPVKEIKVEKDKLTRAEIALDYIEGGRVFLPNSENDPVALPVIAECEAFTRDDSHKHDDLVDMLCHAVQYAFLTKNSSIF